MKNNNNKNIEKSLKKINRILKLSAENLNTFGQKLFEISQNTNQSFNDVYSIAIQFAQKGLCINDILKSTQDAMILTRLAGYNANKSVQQLTDAIKSFNESGLKSTEIINKFAKIDKEFAISTRELTEALQKVGESAKQAKISFNKLIKHVKNKI